MELTIDISNMKDTVGIFIIQVGGEIFYPKIKDNVLTFNNLIQEPQRTMLAFYPVRKIKANPGKQLNEISIEVPNRLFF